MLFDHELLFKATKFRNMLIVERLLAELQIDGLPFIGSILNHDQNGGKSYLEYLVEDLKVTQLLPQYQVMTSKFEILHFSPFLDRTWLSLKRNSNLKDRVLQETEYELNGETVPFTVSSVEGRVRDIVLINVNLFGDHRVLLQSFDEKQDRE